MKVTDARALKQLIATLKAANVSHFRLGDMELTFAAPGAKQDADEESDAESGGIRLPTSWADIMGETGVVS